MQGFQFNSTALMRFGAGEIVFDTHEAAPPLAPLMAADATEQTQVLVTNPRAVGDVDELANYEAVR